MVAKYASLGIGGHENRTNRFNPSGIGGQKLLPQSALTGFDVEMIDTGRQLTRLINVQRAAVRTPGNRLFSRVESRNNPGLAASNDRSRIQ